MFLAPREHCLQILIWFSSSSVFYCNLCISCQNVAKIHIIFFVLSPFLLLPFLCLLLFVKQKILSCLGMQTCVPCFRTILPEVLLLHPVLRSCESCVPVCQLCWVEYEQLISAFLKKNKTKTPQKGKVWQVGSISHAVNVS